MAYWHKYVKGGKKVILIGVNTIKMFFENHTIQRYLQSLKNFATSEYNKDESSLKLALSTYITKEDPIVLLDLTLMNAYEDDVLSLLMSCNKASYCLVAMSSGSGSHFSCTYKEEKLANALLRYVSIEFIPFMKTEAVLFVRLKGVQVPISCGEHEENALITHSVWSEDVAVKFVKKLKPYAGYNPYLMSHALAALQVTEELNVKANTIAVCVQRTEQYIERTLPKEDSPFFLQRLQEIVELLHSAKQKAWINEVEYMKTFVYKHRLAYIVDYKDIPAYVKIAMNFPLLPGLLKNYLHEKLSSNESNRKVDISKYPAVQGYYIEAEFFNHSCLEVATILDNKDQSDDGHGSHTNVILIFPGYHVSCKYEVLETMTTNTLYHLRSDHPIIDGVGLLSDYAGNTWLIFIQISVKAYERHTPNLKALFANKDGVKGYEELSSDKPSMFKYYSALADEATGATGMYEILYLYVSTNTYYDGRDEVFAKIGHHADENCHVALLSKQTDLYKALKQYTY